MGIKILKGGSAAGQGGRPTFRILVRRSFPQSTCFVRTVAGRVAAGLLLACRCSRPLRRGGRGAGVGVQASQQGLARGRCAAVVAAFASRFLFVLRVLSCKMRAAKCARQAGAFLARRYRYLAVRRSALRKIFAYANGVSANSTRICGVCAEHKNRQRVRFCASIRGPVRARPGPETGHRDPENPFQRRRIPGLILRPESGRKTKPGIRRSIRI